MLDFIWLFLLLSGITLGVLTGNSSQISEAILQGAGDGVKITLGMTGIFCLWSGLTEVASRAGILSWLSNLLWPIIHFLMPDLPKNSDATKAISMNLTANLLGVGNAATPLGIKAIQELKIQDHSQDTASHNMIMFLILNVAGMQLVPTMVLSIRQSCGAATASSVLPQIWFVQGLSLTCGILCCLLCKYLSNLINCNKHPLKASCKTT